MVVINAHGPDSLRDRKEVFDMLYEFGSANIWRDSSSESFYGVGSHSDSFCQKLPEENLRVGKSVLARMRTNGGYLNLLLDDVMTVRFETHKKTDALVSLHPRMLMLLDQ